jgi:hypothetical protein
MPACVAWTCRLASALSVLPWGAGRDPRFYSKGRTPREAAREGDTGGSDGAGGAGSVQDAPPWDYWSSRAAARGVGKALVLDGAVGMTRPRPSEAASLRNATFAVRRLHETAELGHWSLWALPCATAAGGAVAILVHAFFWEGSEDAPGGRSSWLALEAMRCLHALLAGLRDAVRPHAWQ